MKISHISSEAFLAKFQLLNSTGYRIKAFTVDIIEVIVQGFCLFQLRLSICNTIQVGKLLFFYHDCTSDRLASRQRMALTLVGFHFQIIVQPDFIDVSVLYSRRKPKGL